MDVIYAFSQIRTLHHVETYVGRRGINKAAAWSHVTCHETNSCFMHTFTLENFYVRDGTYIYKGTLFNLPDAGNLKYICYI